MAAAGFRLAALALACASCTRIEVTERSFDGTQWRVIGIDRAPVRPEAGYRMNFKAGRFSGGFGCNGMSAEYQVIRNYMMIGKSAGGTFHVGWIMSTERDCSVRPDGHFEEDALAILRRPMSLSFRGKRQLVLSNASGSIDLEQVR